MWGGVLLSRFALPGAAVCRDLLSTWGAEGARVTSLEALVALV